MQLYNPDPYAEPADIAVVIAAFTHGAAVLNNGRQFPACIQMDGVCPACGHWHTVATRDGRPSCHDMGFAPRLQLRTTGGEQ